MALFEYRAVDKNGKKLKGKIDAPNHKQAAAKLQNQDLYIVSLTSTKKSLISFSTQNKLSYSKIPTTIITNFTRQFSVLTGTGVPYDRAFEILIQECENAKFQNILSAMKSQIMEGSSMANALQSHPQIFSKMYIALVKAGEAGGTLSAVLERAAQSREDSEELTNKIKGALIYPIVLLIVAIGIVAFMATFLIPKISPIFLQFNVTLPLPTRMVIAMSNFITSNWWLLIIAIIFSVLLFRYLISTNLGEKMKDTFLLKFPVVGKAIHQIIIFRFTRTLGTMLTSGVELKQALAIIKQVLGNRVFEDIFESVIINITKKGMDLSQALRKTELFPPSVTQMIRVGEESSKLEFMLTKISESLEKDVKQTIDKSVALLEPITILWMACVVGYILMAIMLPMFEINQMI
jgi:type II secretory pathway component PulF